MINDKVSLLLLTKNYNKLFTKVKLGDILIQKLKQYYYL